MRYGLICLALIGTLAILAPTSALASGCGSGGSAGDQQYVDPLGCQNPPPSTKTHTTPSSTTTPPPPPATTTYTQPVTTTTTTPTATVATSTTASDPAGKSTLPFTGLDIWPAVGLGVALTGTGLALRRLVRRSE